MTFSIKLGWWLLPLTITIVSIWSSLTAVFHGEAWNIMAPVSFLLAIILSLFSWLLWALL